MNPVRPPAATDWFLNYETREVTGRKTELTWDELIKDNKKIEVDLTGLKA